jgi:ribosomal protein S18 acetylase RimI-like enzyme
MSMPVYKLEAFPQRVRLRSGSTIELRPMVPEDREKLLEFFLTVPEEDRYFLKDDVTSPRVIEGWAAHLDYDRALPLLAWADDSIVGNAVLVRSRVGARRHLGELRVVVGPEYRNLGLGTILARQLCEIAADAELDKVIVELVADREQEAIAAMERLGFLRSARLPEYFKDEKGHPHDLVVMVLPLGKWFEWWTF